MVPKWLHILSLCSLVLGFTCASVIMIDEWHRPQKMWIMNVVWPVTALFGTLAWLWAYFRYGRTTTKKQMKFADKASRVAPNDRKPFAAMVGEGASHCGSGCTLGDICSEWLVFAFPAIAVALGWKSIFPEKVFAVWVLDYVCAFIFGIVFQYFTIAPMRNLGIAQGLWAAVKADTLSLTAWQVGMYGFMAFASFLLFRRLMGTELKVDSVEFWFMMQIAMWFGFVTSYPVNWWLLRAGIKEKM